MPERRLFQELNHVYDDYLKAADVVHANTQPGLVTPSQFAQLDLFDAQAERMRDLALKLADAHHTAEAGFLASANAALANLRAFLIASVVLLLALVAAMGWVIYRDMLVCLQLPPLRERREDIPVLVQHFLRKYAGDFRVEPPTIASDALALLQADAWPGNVRELENITRRLLLAARGLSISAEAVRQTLVARNAEASSAGQSFTALAGELLAQANKGELRNAHARMLAEAEREIVTQAITLAAGNQAKAARWLGLSRFTLREKLKQLGLHPDSTEADSENEA